MSQENKRRVEDILDAVGEGLGPYVLYLYKKKYTGKKYLQEIRTVLSLDFDVPDEATALNNSDVGDWLKAMIYRWKDDIFPNKPNKKYCLNYIYILKEARDKWAHPKRLGRGPVNDQDVLYVADTAIRLLQETNAEGRKQIPVIKEIKEKTDHRIHGETRASQQHTSQSPPPADSLNGQQHQSEFAGAAATLIEDKEETNNPDGATPPDKRETKTMTPPETQDRPSKRTSHANVVIQRPIRQNQGVIRFAIKPNVVIVFLILAIVFILFSTWFIDVLIDMAKDIECNPETLGRRYGGLEHAKATIGCLFH